MDGSPENISLVFESTRFAAGSITLAALNMLSSFNVISRFKMLFLQKFCLTRLWAEWYKFDVTKMQEQRMQWSLPSTDWAREEWNAQTQKGQLRYKWENAVTTIMISIQISLKLDQS